MTRRLIYSAGILIFSTLSLRAQDSLGQIKGKVKDSIYKSILNSATVAVYKNKDSSLIAFCIPNNFGEFSLSNLPLYDTLKIQVTHVGYTLYQQLFVITKNNIAFDFGWIYLYPARKENEEVVITAIPPVRMNGDTLEFNPRAFKMSANATTEDLMRRLPGFTIWSDGEITFNGKRIKALYVDGKPFLGGNDFTAATQNLPKEVLDKVQIYQQQNDKNPLDSTLYANLKLKSNMKIGLFGKEAIGLGSNERYATDVMLTGYNKKLQLSVVGAANNTNKIANSVDELIKTSSYKGEGNNIEYQSDFMLAGLNTPITGGAKLQYDFTLDPSLQKTNRLTIDYLLSHNKKEVDVNTSAYTFLNQDSILIRRSNNLSTNIYTNQEFRSSYKKINNNYELRIDGIGNSQYGHSSFNGSEVQEKTGVGIVSTATSHKEDDNINRRFQLITEFKKRGYWETGTARFKRIPDNVIIKYSFAVTDKEGSGYNRSIYQFNNYPTATQQFDRFYAQKNGLLQKHNLFVQYPNFRQLLFGRKQMGGIDLSLGGTIIYENSNFKDKVYDFDNVSKAYIGNNYLSNRRVEKNTNLSPELSLQKQFSKGLSNRFNKYFNFQFTAREQYYLMRSKAIQVIQNYDYQYTTFLPQALVEYNNHQYGRHEEKYKLKFETGINYPILEYIAPLIDSTNLWFIPRENSRLMPEFQTRYAIQYSIESRKPKNPYLLELNTDISVIKDKISDSTLYDENGKMQGYKINVNGFKNFHFAANFKKSFTYNRTNTFILSSSYNLNKYWNTLFVNSILVASTAIQHNVIADIGYTYKNVLMAKYQQGINMYNSVQAYNGYTKFTSNNFFSRLSIAIELPRNLIWSSNITYNKSISNNRAAIKFTIWNANLAYRFLKGDRAEIKISALDLLKQNKSVINYGNSNTQTFGYNNVLHQYFMLTLAYYPRKFGK